ncbi:CHAT domain-containing protein [Xylariaceae sp. AK1471]|nr:CHAT domain-containing protein [Xylariaceae sp. AK1471]
MLDLDTSTQLLQESVDTIVVGDPNASSKLSALGTCYYLKYLRLRSKDDLDISMQLFQEAFERTHVHHPQRADSLFPLGQTYMHQYLRQKEEIIDDVDTSDLETAIELFQRSLDDTPPDPFNRISRLHALGAGYQERFTDSGALADSSNAIEVFQEALDITISNDLDPAFPLHALGSGYYNRYVGMKDNSSTNRCAEDLEMAIRLLQDSLDKTQRDDPNRGPRLYALGVGYHERYLKGRLTEDLDRATQMFQDSLDHTESPILDRLKAGKILIPLYAASQVWEDAYRAAHTALHLFQFLTPRSHTTSDRQFLLSQFAGLASDAAAIALNCSNYPFDALRFLELGRGLTARPFNERTADITRLLNDHPRLGEEYIKLLDQLNSPDPLGDNQTNQLLEVACGFPRVGVEAERPNATPKPYLEVVQERPSRRLAKQRQNAGESLDELLLEIRKHVGFETYLDVPSEEDMRAAARDGPIVVLNVSDYRCDAILIEKHQIRSQTMNQLDRKQIKAMSQRNPESPEILEWLWNSIANPILDALGFSQPVSGDIWPRLWWIPTGLLGKFALHAAGCHTQGPGKSVLDRVMSSYSSSVKAIIHNRRPRSKPNTTKPSAGQILLVNMQDTPGGFQQLPFASKEISIVRQVCKSMAIDPIEPSRLKEDILAQMRNCEIFHFAGHGESHFIDPMHSSLFLEDWEQDRFRVSDMLDMAFGDRLPFLAYLSACRTGRIRNERFSDESLHLINSCQLVGFRHVVGTLWNVDDELCLDMAKMTYEGMREGEMTDESVCRGLHNATRYLRAHWINNLTSARRKPTITGKKSRDFVENPKNVQNNEQKDKDSSRDIVLEENDEVSKPAHWVPYVHYGV